MGILNVGGLGSIANTSVVAAGTVYTLTNSSAAITFGTTSPLITLNTAGIWLIQGGAVAEYVGATFAANQTLTLKLRRTNNTAADLTGGNVVNTAAVITLLTYSLGEITVPTVVYTTSNSTDTVAIFGGLSAAPSAGSMTISAAWMAAIKIG